MLVRPPLGADGHFCLDEPHDAVETLVLGELQRVHESGVRVRVIERDVGAIVFYNLCSKSVRQASRDLKMCCGWKMQVAAWGGGRFGLDSEGLRGGINSKIP